VHAQWLDLDNREPLRGGTNADRRLPNAQVSDLLRVDEEGIASAQKAPGDRSDRTELKLMHDLRARTRPNGSGNQLLVFGDSLVDDEYTGTQQRLAQERISRQVLRRDDHCQARLPRLKRRSGKCKKEKLPWPWRKFG